MLPGPFAVAIPPAGGFIPRPGSDIPPVAAHFPRLETQFPAVGADLPRVELEIPDVETAIPPLETHPLRLGFEIPPLEYRHFSVETPIFNAFYQFPATSGRENPRRTARLAGFKQKPKMIGTNMSNPTYRIKPATLQEDQAAFAALQNIPAYAPANPKFTVANVQTAADAMAVKQTTEVQQQAALAAARDDATAAEWDFHNVMLGVKEQVKAQFGGDSNEWQALGLVKKSEKAKSAAKKAATLPVK